MSDFEQERPAAQAASAAEAEANVATLVAETEGGDG